MNENDLEQKIAQYGNKDSQQKKTWYSAVAEAYNRVRPRYSEEFIQEVIETAELAPDAAILELGCGPGTATVSFAQAGFAMLCLEPNRDFYQLAKQNCQQYPSIQIYNTTFAEWDLETRRFDAVLAATSFHWIPSAVRYRKTAQALHEDGSLILLWNTGLDPQPELRQEFQEIYQEYAPSLLPYEGRKTQQEHLKGFEEMTVNSGLFTDLVSKWFVKEVTYSTEDYLTLLSTYSPYIELEPSSRASLFRELRAKIEQKSGANIELSYLSAFQVAKKAKAS